MKPAGSPMSLVTLGTWCVESWQINTWTIIPKFKTCFLLSDFLDAGATVIKSECFHVCALCVCTGYPFTEGQRDEELIFCKFVHDTGVLIEWFP